MTRRHLLLGAGAAALAPSLSAFAPDWIAKAKRNLKLGVFTHTYSRFPVAEAAQRMRADGFHSAVMEYAFSDVRFDPLKPDWNAAAKILAAFEKAGLRVAALAAYYNVVDPDSARRKNGEDRIRAVMTDWKRLGSPIVCTETGTLNAKVRMGRIARQLHRSGVRPVSRRHRRPGQARRRLGLPRWPSKSTGVTSSTPPRAPNASSRTSPRLLSNW